MKPFKYSFPKIINLFLSIILFPLLVFVTIFLLKKLSNHAFLWFEPLWICYFFYLSVVYSHAIKTIAFNLGAFVLILFVFELGFSGLINFDQFYEQFSTTKNFKQTTLPAKKVKVEQKTTEEKTKNKQAEVKKSLSHSKPVQTLEIIRQPDIDSKASVEIHTSPETNKPSISQEFPIGSVKGVTAISQLNIQPEATELLQTDPAINNVKVTVKSPVESSHEIAVTTMNKPKAISRKNDWGDDVIEHESSEFFQYSSIYGYAPKKGARARYKLCCDQEDTLHTINDYGFRMTPPVAPSVKDAILFFGDSFTYGAGVNDDEAYPYRLQELLDNQFKIFNFAFTGWGPHQMLRGLEMKTEAESVSGFIPKYGFYLFYHDHVGRLAGQVSWDLLGPRYEVDDKGKAYYIGKFRSMFVARLIKKVINKSHFFRWIYGHVVTNKNWTPIKTIRQKDVERFIAVVSRTKEIFEERYHGKFYVIVWRSVNEAKSMGEATNINKAFEDRGIDYFFAGDMFPEKTLVSGWFSQNYKIRGDGHPNALGHELIASYLAKYIRDLENTSN